MLQWCNIDTLTHLQKENESVQFFFFILNNLLFILSVTIQLQFLSSDKITSMYTVRSYKK